MSSSCPSISRDACLLVTLDPGGPPGERSAEVVLRDGVRNLLRCPVSWEVVAALTPVPKVVVLKPGSGASRVLVRSNDRRPFRVTRVECRSEGLTGRAASRDAAATQVIEVQGDPPPGDVWGVVSVFTDHPAQNQVDLPFVVVK